MPEIPQELWQWLTPTNIVLMLLVFDQRRTINGLIDRLVECELQSKIDKMLK